MIENFSCKHLKHSLVLILISISFLCAWPSSLEAKLDFFDSSDGMRSQRSIESLRDLENQTWQMVVYPKDETQEKFVLRIVGFTGSLRLDHPTNLLVESGLRTLKLEDITLKNPQLASDTRDAAAEFLLDPLLKDLQNNRPLRLSLKGGFTELPVPPYLVKEWRSINPIFFKDDN